MRDVFERCGEDEGGISQIEEKEEWGEVSRIGK